MPKQIFRTQLIILGLIDHIFDLLKITEDRREIRDTLLVAIQANFSNKILENREASEVFKTALSKISDNTDLDSSLKIIQETLEANRLEIDFLPPLKEAAKVSLKDFVVQSGKPELIDVIGGVLQ